MTRKLLITMAMIVLAICLISGGCSSVDRGKIDSWKDMFKISTSQKDTADQNTIIPSLDVPATDEEITVKLYFINTQTKNLEVEQRNITKVEGIARQTMQELLKGPAYQNHQAVAPAGTELLDINIKPDGLCIIDLSSEANQIASAQEGGIMIEAIAKTMSQFPSVQEVSFLIDSQKVSVLGGSVNISEPVLAR